VEFALKSSRKIGFVRPINTKKGVRSMLKYQTNNETTYLTLVNEAIVGAQGLLTAFAFNRAIADFNIAFGSKYDRDIAISLITQWQTEDFNSFPLLEVRSSAEINGANGAYSVSTNKIYIAEEFLLANADNFNALVNLILEEYGHFVDAQINSTDAEGDEGAIFSNLVQGNKLNQQELQALKQENDSAVIRLDGNLIQIEQRRDADNGTSGNDSLYGGHPNETIYGNDGNDIIHGWEGSDTLYGGSGNDTLYGYTDSGYSPLYSDGHDKLYGGDGNDKLYAGYSSRASFWKGNITNAGEGNITNAGENDSLYGGAGNDSLYGSWGNNYLQGDSGDDDITGNGGNDTIKGGDGDDSLSGGSEYNLGEGTYKRYELYGDAGNDVLSGEVKEDKIRFTLWGGSGFDIFILSDSVGRVEEDYSEEIVKVVRDATIDAVGFIPEVGPILSFIGSTLINLFDAISPSNNTPGSEDDDLVYIEDFTFGEDVIVLPKLVKEDSYFFEKAANEDAFWIRLQADKIDKRIAKVQMKNYVDAANVEDLNNFLGKSINTGENDYTVGDVITLDYTTNKTDFELDSQNTNDKISGGTGNDQIDGGGGHDTINGNDGHDKLFGNNGNDRLHGEGGNDTIEGNNGDDRLHGEGGNDTIKGGYDNDWLFGGDGNDQLEGDNGDDRLHGEGGDDTIYGGHNKDVIYGDDGRDKLYGDNDDDQLNGGAGNDELSGGYDNDWLFGDDGNDTLKGDNGRDTLIGENGDDSLIGGYENDLLEGNDGNDYLNGSEGDDYLNGGEGDDYHDGGDGNDTFEVTDFAAENDQYNGEEGIDTIFFNPSDNRNLTIHIVNGAVGDGRAGGQFFRNIEVFHAGKGNDTFNGSNSADILYGNDGNDLIDGHSGNDKLYGERGDDYLNGYDGDDSLYGGDGADVLYGNHGNDLIDGHSGNDKLYGEWGDDYLNGYDGNDSLYGGDGADALYGNHGNDLIDGHSGDDKLYGEWGNDYLNGYNGNDSLYGGDGADALYGNHGNDSVNGGSGNDELYSEWGNDTLDGGEGDDYHDGGDGNDTFEVTDFAAENDQYNGGEGIDTIVFNPSDNRNLTIYIVNGAVGDGRAGGQFFRNIEVFHAGKGNDTFNGSNSADVLYGNHGNDSVNGGSGDDKLYGEWGNDTLSGGIGKDSFAFNSTNEGIDTITDFNTTELDKIQISKSGFGGITHTNNFSFNAANNSLLFGTQQIAILQNISSFNVATDIVLV
jgi:Ca2+-binding RTX toxin-like protein